MNNSLEKIALECLGVPSLEPRGSDRLDFHDCGVTNLKDALTKAYELGKNENNELLKQLNTQLTTKKMKVNKTDINTTSLPEEKTTHGYTNVVLALYKDSYYCQTNTYLPKWQVVNTEYYNKYPDQFEGWIDLEDALPPKHLL